MFVNYLAERSGAQLFLSSPRRRQQPSTAFVCLLFFFSPGGAVRCPPPPHPRAASPPPPYPPPPPHGASNLGDHVLNTVTSIKCSRRRFGNAGWGRKPRSRRRVIYFLFFSSFFSGRDIFARGWACHSRETTFMIPSLVLRHRAPFLPPSVGKKRKEKKEGRSTKCPPPPLPPPPSSSSPSCSFSRRLSEVNFIRSTARCASHVTQSSSLLMKCCIQISACGLGGIRPW